MQFAPALWLPASAPGSAPGGWHSRLYNHVAGGK